MATQSYNYGPGSPLAGGKASQRRIGYRGRLTDDTAGRAAAYEDSFKGLKGFYDLQRPGATQHEKLQRDAAKDQATQKGAVDPYWEKKLGGLGKVAPGSGGFGIKTMRPDQPTMAAPARPLNPAEPGSADLSPAVTKLLDFADQEVIRPSPRITGQQADDLRGQAVAGAAAGRPMSPEVLRNSLSVYAARPVNPVAGSQGPRESILPGTGTGTTPPQSIKDTTGIPLPAIINREAASRGGPVDPHVRDNGVPFTGGRLSSGSIEPQFRVAQPGPPSPRAVQPATNSKTTKSGPIAADEGMIRLYDAMKKLDEIFPDRGDTGPDQQIQGFAEGTGTDQQQKDTATAAIARSQAFQGFSPEVQQDIINSTARFTSQQMTPVTTAAMQAGAVLSGVGVGANFPALMAAGATDPYIVGELGKEMVIPGPGRDFVVANKNLPPYLAGRKDDVAAFKAASDVLDKSAPTTTPVAPLADNPDADAAAAMRQLAQDMVTARLDPKVLRTPIHDKALVPGGGLFDPAQAGMANRTDPNRPEDPPVYTPLPLFGKLEDLADSRTSAYQNYRATMRQAEADAQAGKPISSLAQAEYARQQAYMDNIYAAEQARYKAHEETTKRGDSLLKSLMTQQSGVAKTNEQQHIVRTIAENNRQFKEADIKWKRREELAKSYGMDPKTIAAQRARYEGAKTAKIGFIYAMEKAANDDPDTLERVRAMDDAINAKLENGEIDSVMQYVSGQPVGFRAQGKNYLYLGGKITEIKKKETLINTTSADGKQKIIGMYDHETGKFTPIKVPGASANKSSTPEMEK